VLRKPKLDLSEFNVLIADPSAYSSSLAHSILRALGIHRVTEARDANAAFNVLTEQRVDALMCDMKLPPDGGIAFIHSIRMNPDNSQRTLPILLMTGDTRAGEIKRARDSGADLVVAKPMSPATLQERLTWLAFHPRKFVETKSYFGPERGYRANAISGPT
jgi:two-component system chemotaxis response regulator CheY